MPHDWEMLDSKMENHKSGHYKDFTREKVFNALKEYARGFQIGSII
jgi:hypothetical protein